MRTRAFAIVLAAVSCAPVLADCPPDCNKDGRLNINDFICFQAAWRAKFAYGDYDGSGTYTVNDFIRFQADFASTVAGGGCPIGDLLETELAGNPLGSYPRFEFVNTFNSGGTVSLAVDPARFPTVSGITADVFVVANKTAAQWTSDPSLADVRGAKQTVTFGTDLASSRFSLTGSASLATGTGTDIARGYDLVVDLNRNGVLDSGDLIDGRSDGPGFWVIKDLTTSGSLGVVQVSPFVVTWDGITSAYDEERVYYPSDIASRGKVPLVVISHGVGHQYIYYDYIGNHLASYGCVVMAHQNNVGGIDVAAGWTARHTDAFLDQMGSINGGILLGHVDTDRIIWIGHSRGGEGVARAYTFVHDGVYKPVHYSESSIILVNSIAPVVWNGGPETQLYNANFALIWGSADGDVCGCPGFLTAWSFILLERSFGNRSSNYIQGAGHNDFCCCAFRDFSGPAGTEIGRDEAQQVAKASFLALEKLYAEGDAAAQEYLWRQAESLHAPGVKAATIVDREYKQGPSVGKFVIDDFQTNPSPSVASSGAGVSYSVANVSEGVLLDLDGTYVWSAADPMNGMSRAGSGDETRGVAFDWNGSPAYYETAVPAAAKDLSGYSYLSLRACQETQHPLTAAKLEDLTFTVTLRDGSGKSSSINIGAYGGGIEEVYQRGTFGGPPGWQNEFETIRIRLTDFTHGGSGVDLRNVAAVRLDFGPGFGSPEGRIGLDDIEVVR